MPASPSDLESPIISQPESPLSPEMSPTPQSSTPVQPKHAFENVKASKRDELLVKRDEAILRCRGLRDKEDTPFRDYLDMAIAAFNKVTVTDNHDPAKNFLDCGECQQLIIALRESLSALTNWVLASGTKGLVGEDQTLTYKWVILFDKVYAMRAAFHPDWHKAITHFLLKEKEKKKLTKEDVDFITKWLKGDGAREVGDEDKEVGGEDKEVGREDKEVGEKDKELGGEDEVIQGEDKETAGGDKDTKTPVENQGHDGRACFEAQWRLLGLGKDILNKAPIELNQVALLNLGRFMSLITEMDKNIRAHGI